MSSRPFKPSQVSIRFFIEEYIDAPEPYVRKEINHLRSGIADASGTNVDISMSTASYDGKTYVDGFDVSTDMATITLFIIDSLKNSINEGLDINVGDKDVIVSAEPVGFLRSKRPRVSYSLFMTGDDLMDIPQDNYINLGESVSLKELKGKAIHEDLNDNRVFPIASTKSIEDSISEFIYQYTRNA